MLTATRLLALAVFSAAFTCFAAEPAEAPSGSGVIRGVAGDKEIVITTSERVAGAIHSLTWNGKEFVDSADHGRQFQSAASFDIAATKAFCAECFNPTEAGSRADGAGDKSSSKLLEYSAEGRDLRTSTQMAFWLAPGEKSFGWPAQNSKVLSEHRVAKRVHIGHKDLAQVIEYDVTFTVPQGERHTYAQFEALTGYMPEEFDNFWKFVPTSGKLEKLSDGPGEQEFPVVFANLESTHALGIYSPEKTPVGRDKAGYGRFRFHFEKVVKWNCVFRERNTKEGIAAGERTFRMFVAVGTLDDVRQSLAALVKEFAN